MSKIITDPVIKHLNYKDILIIIGFWYFLAAFGFLVEELTFMQALFFTDFFHYLFVLAARFIYFALILLYLTSLYPISFSDLKIRFSNLKKQLSFTFILVFTLLITVLILINIPLSFKNLQGVFRPLYQTTNPELFINSLLPFFLLFLANMVLALSEQLILANIVCKLFSLYFNKFLTLILSSFFYSILLLHFDPLHILINFIIAFIALFLFLKLDSLISSSLFVAAYYSIYITYIYGWSYIRF